MRAYFFAIFFPFLSWSLSPEIESLINSPKLSQKSTKALLKILKSSDYSEKERWKSGMTLIRHMGKKSLPLMNKLLKHPHWSLRILGLKGMRMLNDQKNTKLIENKLFDKSALVRIEALEVLRAWKSKTSGPKIWKMLFDQKNYLLLKKKKSLNVDMISRIIKTLGDVEYSDVRNRLLKLHSVKDFYPVKREITEALKKL